MTDVEDRYELAPTQEGMLFHSLGEGASGVDIEQIVCSLHEDLDVGTFARAWQRVVERHPILRSSFRWAGLVRPLQEVQRRVALGLEQLDWRAVPIARRAADLTELLSADRRRGFDLTQAPLMLLTLVR